MNIILEFYLELYPKNEVEKDIIRGVLQNELVFQNPKFLELQRMNKSTREIDEFIVLFKHNYIKRCFEIPRASFKTISTLIEKGINIEAYEDKRTEGKKISFNTLFKPRNDQQKDSIDLFEKINFNAGTLKAICGSTNSQAHVKHG